MSTISIQSATTLGMPVARSGSSNARTRLRLTVRGRRVLTALAAAPIALGIAASVLAGGSALASGEQGAGASFETITVLPGDTLWGIATAVAPDVDPRDVIDEIQRLNNLSSGAIRVGTEIAIPAQYTR